jgi:hypothetical protein
MIDPKSGKKSRSSAPQALQICSTFQWSSGLPSTGTYYELVLFIEEHRDEYIRFILHGDVGNPQ